MANMAEGSRWVDEDIAALAEVAEVAEVPADIMAEGHRWVDEDIRALAARKS